MTLRLLCVVALLGGCDLYWNNPGHGDDQCYETPPSAQQLRNPDTGQCQVFQGCGSCEPACGVDIPAWATCTGACEQITTAAACMATPNCHAAFQGTSFWGCWDLEPDPSAPAMCAGLNADQCTGRDDCIGIYGQNDNVQAPVSFTRCAAETGGACDSDTDCVFGDTCDWTDCPPTGPGADSACLGTCVAQQPPPPPACSTLTTESSCKARTDCEPIYNGMNCTCDPQGCTCQIETFAYCQPRQ
jgi:hypothetical protein